MAPKKKKFFLNPFRDGGPFFLWVIKDLGVQGFLLYNLRLIQLYEEDLCKQVTCNDSCICFVKRKHVVLLLCCCPYLDLLNAMVVMHQWLWYYLLTLNFFGVRTLRSKVQTLISWEPHPHINSKSKEIKMLINKLYVRWWTYEWMNEWPCIIIT